MEEKRHTSTQYERELQEIKENLLYLGALTEKAIDERDRLAPGAKLGAGPAGHRGR